MLRLKPQDEVRGQNMARLAQVCSFGLPPGSHPFSPVLPTSLHPFHTQGSSPGTSPSPALWTSDLPHRHQSAAYYCYLPPRGRCTLVGSRGQFSGFSCHQHCLNIPCNCLASSWQLDNAAGAFGFQPQYASGSATLPG